MNRDQYSLENDGSFLIRDYNYSSTFSNFLPGLAGVLGVPMWVFYVNRGQGVVSFGMQDKDHAIAEFFPANKAYSFVSTRGFRTFYKIGNADYEAFHIHSPETIKQSMRIRSASFSIQEINNELGLITTVSYCTLANNPVGGLVRKLSIKNTSNQEVSLQVADGLAQIIPFGTNEWCLKNMSRTIEAWMHCDVAQDKVLFRLIVDPQDSSQTRLLEGANFNYSFYQDNGKKTYPFRVVDPEAIFGADNSLSHPLGFFNRDFSTSVKQIRAGKTPCSFSCFEWKLQPGQERSFYSVYGASFHPELIKKFSDSCEAEFLEEKIRENETLVEDDIKNNALAVTSSRRLNHYLKSTYLDNVLRGGYPYSFDGKHNYYVYSRKHGDLERDYNSFKLLPSYFSEGESNYRDVNQNRRLDLFYNPSLGKQNLVYFLNLLRIDSYNPLLVRGEKLLFSPKEAKAVLKQFKINSPSALELMIKGFHLGEFFRLMKKEGRQLKNKEKLAAALISMAGREPAAAFGEGFWIDHWRYNLDLIENFLYFYPEKLKDIYLSDDYCFWDDEYRIKSRRQRYVLCCGKVLQCHGLEKVAAKHAVIEKRQAKKNFLTTRSGHIYKTNLAVKLLSLILNRAATLDPDGIGIEMEADKPGWCDSLNGLPALFGSSLCETLELKRCALMLNSALNKISRSKAESLGLPVELAELFSGLDKLIDQYAKSKSADKDFIWWNRSNSLKEDFREKAFESINGKEKNVPIKSIIAFLNKLVSKLEQGIAKAKDKKTGVHFTYFSYELKKFKSKGEQVIPLGFVGRPLPLFLEGPVGVLRSQKDQAEYAAVKNSDLFDKNLKMYKLNASLAKEPLEIGRSRIFVPGWLENESIWLHMEYKYLLEVLKCGMYDEFYQDFSAACVCFFDGQRYGRNILENSSFIVSSANPDKELWGKGFVARLSGATVEMLNIWMLMVMGTEPFKLDANSKLCLQFRPLLAADLFTLNPEKIMWQSKEIILPKDTLTFLLFSKTLVVYHNPNRKNTYQKDCRVEKIELELNGKKQSIISGQLNETLSLAVREGKISRIDVHLG